MSTEATKPDQADILAQNGQLTADLDTAKQTIGTLQGQVTALTTERDTARTDLATVTSEREAANTHLAALTQERDSLKAENATLQEQMADFNKRVATELAKHGIRGEGETKAAATPEKPLTLDEKVAAHKAAQAAKAQK